jgi:hypothetical protein
LNVSLLEWQGEKKTIPHMQDDPAQWLLGEKLHRLTVVVSETQRELVQSGDLAIDQQKPGPR